MPDGWWRGQDSARLHEAGFVSGFGPHLGLCRLGEVTLTWLCLCVDWGHFSWAHLVTCAAGCALVAPGSQLGPSHTVVLTVEPRKCAPSTCSLRRMSVSSQWRPGPPTKLGREVPRQAGPCQPLLSGAWCPCLCTTRLSCSPAVCLTCWAFCALAPPLGGGPPPSTALQHST